MVSILVKGTFLEFRPAVDVMATQRSQSCPATILRHPRLPKGLVLTELPRINIEELDLDVEIECPHSEYKHRGTINLVPLTDTACPNLMAAEGPTESDVDVECIGKNKRYRPCRAKRNRHKRVVQRLQTQILNDPEGFIMDKVRLPPSIETRKTERQKLMDRMRGCQHKAMMSMQC